ncbi:MAG: tRNA glutamyl-Q(34) synthetase GluQRS [Devosia sp.]|nr:tRNA glutamyl-Q(34) synthetase GluQRS [Devosia sp.]
MSRSSNRPLLRFAPSPNGLLHLGHAFSALYTWSAAAALGGTALLRIEDIDGERCKPEFTAAILEDLHWLGLDWPEPVLQQSARLDAYADAGERLRDLDLLYPCFCSRAQIAAKATGTDPDGAPLYPGTCRHLSPAEQIERLERGDPVQFRLDTERATAMAGALTFTLVGPLVTDRPQIRYARPERWGDVVLQRKGTPTSYHLSVVVDDAAQGITHVTRGRDMEAATDIHVLLQFLLGLASPIYHFHRLILDEDGKKLSKSRGSRTLRDLRADGWSPDDIRRELGFAPLRLN